MTTEKDDLPIKRCLELSKRAYNRGSYTFSEFLTLDNQNELFCAQKSLFETPYSLFGGYNGAERRIAAFGSKEICKYEAVFPISLIEIKPKAIKFADELTHRDFLGALMSLGMRREVLGDIVVSGKTGYVYCLDSSADYIIENLTSVKRTSVVCSRAEEIPDFATELPDETTVFVASERLDGVISAVYKLSRSETQGLIEKKTVFVNSRLTEKSTLILEEKDIVSVRGYGRFIYEGISRSTKKGRLCAEVRIY